MNVLALALGTSAINLNIWWIDVGFLTVSAGPVALPLGELAEAAAAMLLVAWALFPDCGFGRRVATSIAAGLLALLCLVNGVSYWMALASGQLYSALPIPLSLVLCIAFALLAWCIATGKRGFAGGADGACGVRGACAVGAERDGKRPEGGTDLEGREPFSGRFRRLAPTLSVALAAALVFPLLQIGFFGTTDYRRSADCAVVLGAEVHADGTLSRALAERMDTAIQLYDQGLVEHLICSGGVDANADEAQAMAAYARRSGVPASALILDNKGDSTQMTVSNTLDIAQRQGFDSIMVTSSFYHMPRIKMLFQTQGAEVLTVPTVGNVLDNGTSVALWREIPAWWVYWLKGSFGLLG